MSHNSLWLEYDRVLSGILWRGWSTSTSAGGCFSFQPSHWSGSKTTTPSGCSCSSKIARTQPLSTAGGCLTLSLTLIYCVGDSPGCFFRKSSGKRLCAAHYHIWRTRCTFYNPTSYFASFLLSNLWLMFENFQIMFSEWCPVVASVWSPIVHWGQ